MGLREDILAAQDRKIEPVEVPEWGVTGLCLRTMSVGELEEYEGRIKGQGAMRTILTVLAVCLSDEAGNRVFSDEDIDLLAKKSAAPLMRLAQQATALNKMSEKDLDAAEGESEGEPAASTFTGSPNGSVLQPATSAGE